ncbi:phosphoribosylanthranilate isomerase [Pseudotenacibaculum sp. MALMAid0570]|uniref:phosphoribosylanthranilate isomerase n=1 Tax=Pseudotenacibaculum sp. MALMAid0570 TaxID=3143938 RepID=UPI0032DE88BE
MKLKVCGMKYVENLQSVAQLQPDYLGFIFYEQSPRNFEGVIPEIPKTIKKTGVFVNEFIEILVSLVQEYKLEAIQLHGDETIEYIQEIKSHLKNVEIIKVFGIKDDFDFSILESYKDEVDYFLFDTKGKERGGNGVKFDWLVLKKYPYQKPFFLSGGIGPNDIEEIKKIKNSGLPIHTVDINSRFEIEPGVKNIKLIKKFKNEFKGL